MLTEIDEWAMYSDGDSEDEEDDIDGDDGDKKESKYPSVMIKTDCFKNEF